MHCMFSEYHTPPSVSQVHCICLVSTRFITSVLEVNCLCLVSIRSILASGHELQEEVALRLLLPLWRRGNAILQVPKDLRRKLGPLLLLS